MLIEKDRNNFYMLNWLNKYMIGHKGFIAGGCFKNIFQQEKVKDLDIFFENKNDFREAVNYFDSMTPGYMFDDKRPEEYIFVYESPKVKAYRNKETGILVELNQAVFGKPKDVLSQFDFTITKFAYYKKEVEDEEIPFEEQWLEGVTHKTHIEYKIVCDDNFFEHLHLHRLVTDDKILYPMSTYERMIRYVGYGYKPCRETKIKIAMAIWELDTANQIIVGDSLYDGVD